MFLVADGPAKLSGRDYEVQEPTLRREQTVRREDLSGESQDDREEFQPEESEDDVEVRKDFWSIQGYFIYCHHIESRVQQNVLQEESFPIPLTYFDVIRSTRTDLDVAEKQKSVRFVDGCHKIYIIERNSSKRIFHQVQITHGLTLGQELEKLLKEKNEYGQSRNQNSNMQEILKGIYYIVPSDEEYKDIIIKNARRKLETPMAAAMPWKRAFSQAGIRETVDSKTEKAKASEAKTRFSCITQAQESTRQRMESVMKRIHEEHTAGKGQNSVLHYNSVHKFVPMKGSHESSSSNVLKVKASARCLVSRHSVSVRQNSSSNLKKSGKCEKLSTVNREERSKNSEYRSDQRTSGIESYVWFRRFWRSVSQFQMQRRQWKRNERIS